MTRQEALDRVNELKGYLGDEDALLRFQGEINALSLAVLGKAVKKCNCRNRLGDALIEIYRKLKSNEKMRIEITTKMRRGFLIHWDGKVYSCFNITDEVAREYLAKFPQNKHYFEVLPPKAEDKAEDKAENAVNSAENAPQSQENAEVIVDTPKKKKARKTAKNG